MWLKLLNKSYQVGIWGGAACLGVSLVEALLALANGAGESLVVYVICMVISFALMVVSFLNRVEF